MDKYKILSGKELVARGVTKYGGVLPELGIKDVLPNGSWLEQKQVQSALEARKQLIQVERIEKSGSVSHAEWHEDLMLAEVTQNAGGHWQYMGHNVGKHLYLFPEEALFLMELNALQLTYNEVTVSLQQAYALLLRSKISLTEYKVYAQLSRVGYKVFRHDIEKSKLEKNIQSANNNVIEREVGEETGEEHDGQNIKELESDKDDCSMKVSSNILEESISIEKNTVPKSNNVTNNINGKCENMENVEMENETCVEDEIEKERRRNLPEVSKTVETNSKSEGSNVEDAYSKDIDMVILDSTCEGSTEKDCEIVAMETAEISAICSVTKLDKLKTRQLKPSNPSNIWKFFETVPDLCQKQFVTVGVPKGDYLPQNIRLEKYSYVLNVESMRSKKKDNGTTNDSTNYLNQVNAPSMRRITGTERETVLSTRNNWSVPFFKRFYPLPHRHYNARPFRQNFRPRSNLTRYEWELYTNYMSRPGVNRRPPLLRTPTHPFANFQQRTYVRSTTNFANINNARSTANVNSTSNADSISNVDSTTNAGCNPSAQSTRKRSRESFKKVHMDAIKKLAERLKTIVQSGINQAENVVALNRLVNTYNSRYRTKLTLTEDFELCNDETILDTIELDDDEETVRKRRKESYEASYKDHLNEIKELAASLKELEKQDRATPRHRRVLSSLIKRFNKSYDTDMCLKNNEIIDKKLITLDSSSESDCIIEEPKKVTSGKKLKNPFSILKRLSQKGKSRLSDHFPNDTAGEVSTSKSTIVTSGTEAMATTSGTNTVTEVTNAVNSKGDEILKRFGKWLPPDGDFGTAEVPLKNTIYNFLYDLRKDEYIFEFIKNDPRKIENWLDIKICYLEAVESAQRHIAASLTEPVSMEIDECSIKPIIGPEDDFDSVSVLSKLRIIKTFTDTTETNLHIDFDVYNRDVQNFRKTCRPKPHFRVICVSESSKFPSGRDVAALHSSYEDDVTILFAAVGMGSVSFLQINPSDMPVYVPQQDLKGTDFVPGPSQSQCQ